MKEPDCSCTGPGFCPRFQIYQEEYAYNICSNNCGDEDKSNRMRKKWREKLAKGEPPSVTRKLVNFGLAMVEGAKTGFKKVPLSVYTERKEHCDKCDLNKNQTCTHPKCGCPINKRLLSVLGVPGKLELASQECPMGHWGKYEEANAD